MENNRILYVYDKQIKTEISTLFHHVCTLILIDISECGAGCHTIHVFA